MNQNGATLDDLLWFLGNPPEGAPGLHSLWCHAKSAHGRRRGGTGRRWAGPLLRHRLTSSHRPKHCPPGPYRQSQPASRLLLFTAQPAIGDS